MAVVPEPLNLPEAYGRPTRTLGWDEVRARLEASPHYWVATVRPDGRPHLVPKDGLWLDGRLWFGGSPNTVNHRNLTEDGNVAVHVGDGTSCAIVEGVADLVRADDDTAARLSQRSKEKYGYGPPPSTYAGGIWAVSPARVLAWTAFPTDATRFRFTAPVAQPDASA